MTAFFTSLLFVTLAEMGDKTQLLAMAFAAKFKAWQVLIAVLIATLANHALAVALGNYLAGVVPLDIVSLVVALSFILFGLWTVRGDKPENAEKHGSRFGPIATVTIAFFFAEMGDKTQLTTMSLAAEYLNPAQVLAGTTLGMLAADALGIFAGALLAKTVSEKTIQYVAAGVFILFGLCGVYKYAAERTYPVLAWLLVAGVAAAAASSGHSVIRRRQIAIAPKPEAAQEAK